MEATAHTAPQDGHDQSLMDDLLAFMRRFVVFQDDTMYDALALWILHTYAFDAAQATPYIYVRSAEPQSGKTRTIEVAHLLAKGSTLASDLTASVLFRVIEAQRPAMFIDEVDTIFTGAANESLRGVLNSGYKSNGTVLRTVPGKDGGEVMSFSTFCPKLMAGIDNGQVPDTILDRCIIFNLKRKKRDQEVERMVARRIQGEVDTLKERMSLWASHNMDALLDASPTDIPDISDRAFEIAEPLLAIGGRFRGWTKRSRASLTHLLSAREEKMSQGAQVLKIAQDIFNEGNRAKVTSAELAQATDVTPKKLGVILSKYGITPTLQRFGSERVARGYTRKDFNDAWERYL